MAVLKLYEYPDEVLRKKCERVSKVDSELRRFLGWPHRKWELPSV